MRICSKAESTSAYSLKSSGLIVKHPSDATVNGELLPDHVLSADEIRAGLKNNFWREIVCCQAVSSTNDLGLSLPLPPDPEFEQGTAAIAIAADAQEKGRGRFDRRWVSPPGLNIYLSILLKPALPPAEAPCLTFAAALAAAEALYRETGLQSAIKWPNDLLLSGRKLGGILTEARTVQGVVTRAVIGIGINLNSAAGDLPPELSGKATSALIETGHPFSRNRLITAILCAFEDRFRTLKTAGGAPLIRELKPLLGCLGREILVMDGEATLSGVAEDIDDDGRLVLRLPSGLRKKIGSGEITEQGAEAC